MEHKISMQVDPLGRVHIPDNIMQLLGWNPGDKLGLQRDNNTIVITLNEKHSGPECAICKKLERKIRLNGLDFCESCVETIKAVAL